MNHLISGFLGAAAEVDATFESGPVSSIACVQVEKEVWDIINFSSFGKISYQI